MTDVMTPEQRRKAMRSNRGRTAPEKRLASALWRRGFRFFTTSGYERLCQHRLRGRPDLIFPSRRTVIFMDGCFWHGCEECHNFGASCNATWQAKISRNVERDNATTKALAKEGWRVLRVWEHELRPGCFEKTIDRLVEKL